MINIALEQIRAYRQQLIKEADLIDRLEDAVDQIFESGNFQPVSKPPPNASDSIRTKKHEEVHVVDESQDMSKYRVTSPFGQRINPVTKKPHFHNGIDIAAPNGTPVLAWSDGVVGTVANKYPSGLFVYIKHSDEFATSYSHLSAAKVKVGDRVSKGQVIGLVGSTGRSTGNHVHFRMKHENEDIDPAPYLEGNPILGG